MANEPILFIIAGGVPLMIGLVHLLRAFGVPISEPEEAAINALWAIVLSVLARMMSVSVASLPPGTMDKILADRAANTGAANAKP